MARKIDITFNSEKDTDKLYHLASGYISETTVLFEKEHIIAVVQAKGSVEFYSMDDVLIATGKVESKDSGKGVYEEIKFRLENNSLILSFPIYEWIDNYPNCDGEHDRWDTKIIGFHSLTFDLTTHSIS